MSVKSIVFCLLLANLVVLAPCQPEQDICLLASDEGPCRAYIPSWFYSPSSEKCEPFVYGGCDGNANRFNTEGECIRRCVCTRPPYTGPCRAAFPRYYYDKSTGRCEEFVYGGCDSNGNNFDTEAECTKTCSMND